MKKTIQGIVKIATFERAYSGQILLIVMGFLMAFAVLLKLSDVIYINSDWFIAGVGLAVEGILMMRKQARFDKKYKIIERSGEEKP